METPLPGIYQGYVRKGAYKKTPGVVVWLSEYLTEPYWSVRYGRNIPTEHSGKVRYEPDTGTRHFGKFGKASNTGTRHFGKRVFRPNTEGVY